MVPNGATERVLRKIMVVVLFLAICLQGCVFAVPVTPAARKAAPQTPVYLPGTNPEGTEVSVGLTAIFNIMSFNPIGLCLGMPIWLAYCGIDNTFFSDNDETDDAGK